MSLRIALVAAALTAALPAAAADRYTIDSDHTFPSLEFPHMGLSVWRGKFDRTRGEFVYDRAAKTGSVKVVVDTDSIDFGLASMHEYAVKPEWLDVAKYPTMTYDGALVFAGDAPTAVDGTLTLRGVSRPLRLTINSFKCIEHPYFKKEVCGADAEGDLDRADWGISQYTDNGMGRLHLRIQVEALKNP
jgi:polyisoprenoid-binding protein YceI